MTDFEKKFLDVARLIKRCVIPQKTNLKKFRLGEERDGGYVVAELENDSYDALYSYGCDDNITFENAFNKRYGKECYVYDPFKGITNKPHFINYFEEGLAHENFYDAGGKKFGTIDTHIEQNGHTESSNLMAQIDVEGSEWNVFASSIKYLKNFSQLLIEFHMPIMGDQFIRMEPFIKYVFETLNEHFVCVHFHGNNAPLQPWLDGYFPRMFEVTYVRKDLIKEHSIETESCPMEGLDYACATDRPDIRVDYWLNKKLYEE
jgi:hypothetical protein